MTHIRNGTEYLDAQEMHIYRAVDRLVRAGRSGNTSQVASETRIGRTTVNQILYHLAARGFLTDISNCAAHYWRLTRKPAVIDPELEGPRDAGDSDLARYLPCRGPGGCGAQPGRPCTTTDLRVMTGIHEARRRLLSDGGEVRMGSKWTTQRVMKYGLVVKDNLANGSNPPSPDEWDDAERDKAEKAE